MRHKTRKGGMWPFTKSKKVQPIGDVNNENSSYENLAPNVLENALKLFFTTNNIKYKTNKSALKSAYNYISPNEFRNFKWAIELSIPDYITKIMKINADMKIDTYEKFINYLGAIPGSEQFVSDYFGDQVRESSARYRREHDTVVNKIQTANTFRTAILGCNKIQCDANEQLEALRLHNIASNEYLMYISDNFVSFKNIVDLCIDYNKNDATNLPKLISYIFIIIVQNSHIITLYGNLNVPNFTVRPVNIDDNNSHEIVNTYEARFNLFISKVKSKYSKYFTELDEINKKLGNTEFNERYNWYMKQLNTVQIQYQTFIYQFLTNDNGITIGIIISIITINISEYKVSRIDDIIYI